MPGSIGKSAGGWIFAHRLCNEVKAKTTITDPWRSRAMIKGRNSQRVHLGIDIKGLHSSDNRTSIEILQLDVQPIRFLRPLWRLRLIDNLKPHLLNHRQTIV